MTKEIRTFSPESKLEAAQLMVDQGSQFASEEFAGVLNSMDDKGRWVDNVFVERLWRSSNMKWTTSRPIKA